MEEIPDLQCCVCTQIYSDKSAPRSLECGHCVCTTCLKELINVSPECPECRKRIKVKDAAKLSINHSLLRLARMYAFVNLKEDEGTITDLVITQPEGDPAESAGVCTSHGHNMYFMCIRCDVPICRNCLISDHPDQPYGRCVIMSLKERTDKIRETNIELVTKYLKEVDKLSNKLGQIKKGYQYAVQYWEKRPEDSRGEDWENNLEKAKLFFDEASKEFDEGLSWKNSFIEIKDKMEASATKEDVLFCMEKFSNMKSDYDPFHDKERETQFYDTLGLFWKGAKFKLC